MKQISKLKVVATLLMGMAIGGAHGANPFGDNGQEYLLVGYSMFDFSLEAEDQNVFCAGGRMCSYPVYLTTNTENGTFQIYNLVNLSSDIAQQPVNGALDAATGTMTIATMPNFQSVDQTAVIAASGKSYIVLQSGNPIGAGYWNDAEKLTITSDAGGNVLTPTSGFGAFGYEYDDYWGDFNSSYIYDVMYNTHLYKVREGVNILPSSYEINMGECFVGRTRQIKFTIINAGSEESDYLLKINGDAFDVNTKSGYLGTYESNEITVTFAPSDLGEYQGSIKIQSEGEPIEITLKGQAMPFPDFAQIVTESADRMKFSTSDVFPWHISSDITDSLVAVSSNVGVDDSSSWLAVSVSIPEGEKGVLLWTGYYDPHYGTRDRCTVTDNGAEVYTTPIKHQICDIDGAINLLAGDHEIVFAYSKEMSIFPQGVEFGNDRVWLKSLALNVSEYRGQAASLKNAEVEFDRFFLVTSAVEHAKEGPVLVNEGYENLQIKDVRPDGIFYGKVTGNELKPEERMDITIGFRATEPGDYEGNVVVVTSAGEFPVHCRVLVEPSPDYSSIVTKGEFIFVPDNSYPFVVEDGKAYNCTAGIADNEETLSVLTAVFNVPAGKYGKLTWDGQVDTQGNDWTADYGVAMIDNNAYNLHFYHGHDYAGHYSVEPYEVYFTSGTHMISWGYVQCGDGKTFGNDRLTISNLSIDIINRLPALEVWEPTPIDMGEVFGDSFNEITLQVANLSKSVASFTKGDTSDDFTLNFDEEMNSEIPSMGLGTVELTFTPSKPGDAATELTLQASTGSVTIPVSGYGIDTALLSFHEDFEDGFADWKTIDANKDRYFWEPDVAGTYSRTGLGSAMIGTVFSDYTDDYLVSPTFTVPTEHPVLEYWRRYTKGDNNDYDVLIGEGDDPAIFDVLFTDEGHSQYEFEKIKADLSEYAGRKVRIAFHNRTCDKKSVLIIDDIAVSSNGIFSAALPDVISDAVSSEFFNLQGVRLSEPPAGIYIEKVIFSDGTVKTYKRVNK